MNATYLSLYSLMTLFDQNSVESFTSVMNVMGVDCDLRQYSEMDRMIG